MKVLLLAMLLSACSTTDPSPVQSDPWSFTAEIDRSAGRVSADRLPSVLSPWMRALVREQRLLGATSTTTEAVDDTSVVATMWALEALLELDRGSVTIDSGRVSIRGEARDAKAVQRLVSALGDRAAVTLRAPTVTR